MNPADFARRCARALRGGRDATETVYTTAQAAKLLGVTAERVRQLRRAGALAGRQTPLGWLFARGDVLALKDRRAQERVTR